MRKISKVFSAFLAVMLLITAFGTTAFADSGNTTLTAQVPCTVTLQIGEHGSITVDGTKYVVMAVFLSRIYDKEERGVFRYYEYFDLSEETVFSEYVRQVKAAALYDTGIDAEYGDELLVLSTCNYHTADGRFVVVAKRII